MISLLFKILRIQRLELICRLENRSAEILRRRDVATWEGTPDEEELKAVLM
jgi:hypothetical protein